MADAILEFLGSYKPRLIRVIQDYLVQRLSHEEVKHLAWEIIDTWSGLTDEAKAAPYLEGEKPFWATVWASVHLANNDHWDEGLCQEELGCLLQILKRGGELPAGHDAKRP
jgi:hypothetical protein